MTTNPFYRKLCGSHEQEARHVDKVPCFSAPLPIPCPLHKHHGSVTRSKEPGVEGEDQATKLPFLSLFAMLSFHQDKLSGVYIHIFGAFLDCCYRILRLNPMVFPYFRTLAVIQCFANVFCVIPSRSFLTMLSPIASPNCFTKHTRVYYIIYIVQTHAPLFHLFENNPNKH